MTNTNLKLDEVAKELARDFLKTEGRLLKVLIEMRRRKVFVELCYNGIFDYCERALKLSRAQSYYFKSVAEKAEEVPEVRDAVVQGKLTLSQARRIVSVITPANQKEWIDKAKNLPQKELEREVTKANPKAHVNEKLKAVSGEVSELRVAVSGATERNLLALREILSQKFGKPATLSQVVAWAAEVCREKHDPIARAKRSLRRVTGVTSENQTRAIARNVGSVSSH